MNITDIKATDAWEILQNNSQAILIDARTEAEWKEIGVPKLDTPSQLLLSTWRVQDDGSINPNFKKKLEEAIKNQNNHILFICRSGGRSYQAASFIANCGFCNCYNIIDGFEGSHSGKGWKLSNLPWEYYKDDK